MHKATFIEGTLQLTIQPNGPVLVKAGESGGADPTLPDMEFVRTKFRAAEPTESDDALPHIKGGVYIPGPSLKGVIRVQCERICRSLDGPERYEKAQARAPDGDFIPPLADNSLLEDKDYQEYEKGGNDLKFSSGIYFNRLKSKDTALIYRRSSFVSQMFGHTSLAGRIRFADAYGKGVVTEERNGVAIDRVYGSVAVGPFNYETVVAGSFPTRIDFKNVTLAQLGLLGLALRDLADGRIGIGFGKSRGLGRVKVAFDSLTLRYPVCELQDGKLRLLNGMKTIETTKLAGVGAFADRAYSMPENDLVDLPTNPALAYEDDYERGIGVTLDAKGDTQVRAIWKACMPAWKRELGL
ncbi:MAG: RAMP superfamily CRISPR-associated protein [Chloroflexales bacterium]|nr:RAMP superfamily CRISPR-associated protein [Chloroflexales bacterium]